MAETQAAELVAPGTEGAIECQAEGCSNWFVKRSGRHIYCKAEGCTYKRTTSPPAVRLDKPTGAAEEILRRLQDPDGAGDVSHELLGARLREVSKAERAGDQDALFGALVDSAAMLGRWAERVRSGEMLPRRRENGSSAPAPSQSGLVAAVLSSHARTVMLANRRTEAVWSLLKCRDALAEAQQGVASTMGTEQSVIAEAQMAERRREYERAERTLQSLEAAWAERQQAAAELVSAGRPTLTVNGGANGRAAAA